MLEAEVVDRVRGAVGPLLIEGHGTKSGMLRPVQASATLSTRGLTGITLYAPNELVMSARAGTPLGEIEAALAEKGQQMIAEPTHLFGEDQTIGGVVAANLSGPRRVMGGALRDHVLGVRCVNGSGELLRFGGRVLKNVTGLDIGKFLTGSFGTLAVLTEVTFKVLPVTEAVGTVAVPNLDAAAAIKLLSAGIGSPFSVSGAAYNPANQTAYLRIEEFATSVTYRTGKLAAQFPNATILDTTASKSLWASIRDCKILEMGDALWRISLPPSAAPALLATAHAAGLTGFLDWAGGLMWLTGPATTETHQAVTAAARTAGAIWWLVRAPAPLRAAVDVIPPEAPALAKLRQKIQYTFDPKGIFNPGKMRAA